MLEVADVCPSCGQTHSDSQFGIAHGGPRECPRVVLGSFPVITQPEPEVVPEPLPESPAARRIREFETPAQVSVGSLPLPGSSRIRVPSSIARGALAASSRPRDVPMTDPKIERLPCGSAARRIRDFEVPFVSWETRLNRSTSRTQRGIGSLLDCAADDFLVVEVV